MAPLRAVIGSLVIAAGLSLLASCADDEGRVVTLGGSQASSALDQLMGSAAPSPEPAETPLPADLDYARDLASLHDQAVAASDQMLAVADLDERVEATADYVKTHLGTEAQDLRAWLAAWAAEGHRPTNATTAPLAVPDLTSTRTAPVAYLTFVAEHDQRAAELSRSYLEPAHNSYTRGVAKHLLGEVEDEITYLDRLREELCADESVPACAGS